MKRLFTAIVFVSCLLPIASDSSTVRREISDKYTLLEMIERSDIVCIGQVANKTGVLRRNIRPGRARMITSDITFRVTTMIKGQPNHGSNHVKFMIEGGTVYVPEEDEVITLDVINNLYFEPGDKALIFLSKNPGGQWYANYPYDRLHIHTDYYGKRPIKDNKVMMLYKRNSRALIGVKLPTDLVSVLGKAFIEDEATARSIEESIKSAARTQDVGADLTTAVVNQVKTAAQKVVDDAREED